MKEQIDARDRLILELLQQDCSQTSRQIAKRLNVPITTAHNRIVRLETKGVITGYRANVDWKKLGFDITALINITVNYTGKDYSQEDTARRIRGLPGVESVAIVTGTTDMVAKVRKKNTDDLNNFLINHLRKIPGIDKTTTFVVLKEFG